MRSRTVGWAVFVVGCALTAATLALIALNWSTEGRAGLSTSGNGVVNLIYATALLSIPAVGSLVVAHRPENAIGWILSGCGLSILVTNVTQELGFYGLLTEPAFEHAGRWSAWTSTAIYNLSDPLLTMLLALFPTGHATSGQRRWVIPLAAASAVTLTAVHAFGIPRMNTPFEFVDNPFGPEEGSRVEAVFGVAGGLAFVAFVICILAGLVSQVRRFQRSTGAERAQVKWMLLAAATLATSWLAWAVVPDGTPAGAIAEIGISFTVLVIPLAAGLAILRYRLYDIDLVINRALVYGSLTAGTVASYAALVVGLGWAARTVAGQEGNEVVVAATTLIVAALFQPARRRIQSLVDRRFYRARYDAARTLEAFQARLREELDLEALRGELARTVHRALRPETVEVWLRSEGAR